MMKRTIAVLCLLLALSAACLAEPELKQFFSEDEKLLHEDYMENDQLVMGPKGFARHTYEYDDQGNAVREAYYDASEVLVKCSDGIVVLEREFDDSGRVSLVRYLDADGQLMCLDSIGAYAETFG